jgi:cytochrome c peroxidase
MKRLRACVALVLPLLSSGCLRSTWSEEQKAVLRDLRLVESSEADPTNRYADDERAARFGQRLFFDVRLSSNGAVACATCHVPMKGFQDGTPVARGVGITSRRTMPIAGTSQSPWFFWDGRKDSAWSQALGPLENPDEHDLDRVALVRVLAEHYASEYEALFGPLPDTTELPEHASPNRTDAAWDAWQSMPDSARVEVNRAFANAGKAIAAYERKLQPGTARFDRFVDAVLKGDDSGRNWLSSEERAGLELFIGKANCIQCHNGPRFTNDDFANTGVPASRTSAEDTGRRLGAGEALQDEFNCLSPYSDATPEQCRELAAVRTESAHAERQFKVPSLRDVADRAPYMHAGQFATLEAVIEHYDRAPSAPSGHSELVPLGLSESERRALVSFLHTLSAPLATEQTWLVKP